MDYLHHINTIIAEILPFQLTGFIFPICKNIAIYGISGIVVRSGELYLTVLLLNVSSYVVEY